MNKDQPQEVVNHDASNPSTDFDGDMVPAFNPQMGIPKTVAEAWVDQVKSLADDPSVTVIHIDSYPRNITEDQKKDFEGDSINTTTTDADGNVVYLRRDPSLTPIPAVLVHLDEALKDAFDLSKHMEDGQLKYVPDLDIESMYRTEKGAISVMKDRFEKNVAEGNSDGHHGLCEEIPEPTDAIGGTTHMEAGLRRVRERFAGSMSIHRGMSDLAKDMVFVQGRDKVFRAKSGWSVQYEKVEDGSIERAIMRSEDGTIMGTTFSVWDFRNEGKGKFFTYEQRTGRSGETEMDIKYGPSHFPEGTVFEVNETVGERLERDNYGSPKQVRFTVDYIEQNGARSYCIMTKELRRGIIDKETMESHGYNISHVRKIISRGTGKVKFGDDQDGRVARALEEERTRMDGILVHFGSPDLNLKKGDMLFNSYDHPVMSILRDIGILPDNCGKWIDEPRTSDFIHNNGMGRMVVLKYPDREWDYEYFYIVNVPKLKKWLKKNQHRVLHSLNFVEKEETERDRRECESIVWD